jgi:primosomal protein N' (replication factor Y)
MIQIRLQSADKDRTAAAARELGDLGGRAKQADADYQTIDILGPLEAPLSRIANQYRWQLLIKSPRVDSLHRFVRQLLFDSGSNLTKGGVKISLDVDPLFLM